MAMEATRVMKSKAKVIVNETRKIRGLLAVAKERAKAIQDFEGEIMVKAISKFLTFEEY